MSEGLIFTNARLVLPDEIIQGQLAVEDGRIAGYDTGSSRAPCAIDCDGDYLLPGLIELHTDNFERHLMPRPQVSWPAMPALLAHDAELVAAGITTVFDALGVGETDPVSLRAQDWQPVLDTFDHCCAQDLLRAEHFLHARCELPAPNTIALFAPFCEHPRLGLISLMDHTPGQRQWENIDHARIYFTGKKGWSLQKFEEGMTQFLALQARYTEPHRRHFVEYCKEYAIALASHDDTTEAHVREAHAEGAAMVEFPTTLVAARCARAHGLYTIMGAPNLVRGGSHSGNVAAQDLAREGLLDILSSDYVPGGLPMAMMRLVQEDLLSLPQAVACVTSAPARAAGLGDRGALLPGLRADIIRVRPTPQLQDIHPHAVVRAVWRAGRLVL